MVVSCQYNLEDCNLTETVDFYDPYNGLCHMINPNMTWNSSRAGPYNGMRIALRSPSDTYLPWESTAAIIFFIHGTNETPFQDAFGYFAEIGRCNSVGMTYMKRQKLPEPYNDCSDDGDGAPNYYSNGYEIEACIRSCLQNNIIDKCGCYDPQYNYPSNVTVPSCYNMGDINAAMDCADAIINVVDQNSVSNNSACNCPYGCDLSYYKIGMSQTNWPASTYTPSECTSPSAYWTTVAECIQWYKDNTAMLEIYYEQPSYQSNVETSAYTVINMVADIGGQLGLWLGMSVISIVEMFILACATVAFMIIRPEPINLDGYDYWAEFDKPSDKRREELYAKGKSSDDDLPPRVTYPQPVENTVT
ncbi:unnamed protein product [Bursaphelenchus okinawaensis]|uniref:Uncharacterized protein n=1 Tax=Bursaphelenchus okinawaensis TaxID=465554 RepID=A0A811K1U7_9BILA|nr:unnamed protein product [Bursaphelenchus okinawaensis]CAG9089728.1 unnamed protein product [Bursaphelenchus okinawaensis]